MDDLTKRRLAHNEEVFKAINEEVSSAHARPDGAAVAFICECADRDCTERVELTGDEYRRIRSDERRFVVAPGHVVPEIEHVVEERPTYDVVVKNERAA